MKIKNLVVESTPVTELLITPHGNSKNRDTYMFKVFWSQNRGIYGYQIGYQIFKNHTLVLEGKTGGCGYCKESIAFETFLTYLKGSYISCGGTVNWYLYKFKKGGNFYQCTQKQLWKTLNVLTTHTKIKKLIKTNTSKNLFNDLEDFKNV